MNLYKISQEVNNGYDTYDSAIVAAEDEFDARNTHPDGNYWGHDYWCEQAWDDPKYVIAVQIGTALPGTSRGVILASFNAG